MALVKDLARAAADQILDEHWDGTLPVNPVAIAHQLGIRVWNAVLPEDESGRIVKEADTPADIYLNRDEPALRKTFTVAHELGHYVERKAQADDEYSFVDLRGGRPMDAHEWYAEHFAANLLMPVADFIRAYDDAVDADARGTLDSDVTGYLSRRFGTSRTAVANRIRNLRLAR